jgi:hypothetical protein
MNDLMPRPEDTMVMWMVSGKIFREHVPFEAVQGMDIVRAFEFAFAGFRLDLIKQNL